MISSNVLTVMQLKIHRCRSYFTASGDIFKKTYAPYNMLSTVAFETYITITAIIILGSNSGVSVCRASGQDPCSEEPGVSLCPSYENGGREVPHGMIVVLLQDIPGEKGSLLIRYPNLMKTIY